MMVDRSGGEIKWCRRLREALPAVNLAQRDLAAGKSTTSPAFSSGSI
jgi:hypothetical protein